MSTPVRIGALAPLSRPGWAEAGQHLLAGMELAVRDALASGGVGGRELELVVRDTAADPQRAADAVDELAEAGVVALVGEYHSVVARAVATRADARQVPYLCASSVIDVLTEQPSDWVARLSPPQSRGWRVYADHLAGAGHSRIAVAYQAGAYWAAGTRILSDRLAVTGIDMGAHTVASACDALVEAEVSALLLLAGHPEPAIPLVAAVRSDPRFEGLLVGAPAGQPEFPQWEGELGAGIPFLRYLPEQLGPLGLRVEKELGAPSFVAYEGYDAATVLTEALRIHGADRARIAASWPSLVVDGTRGRIRFSRTPGSTVWQWADAPVQVVDRDPASPDRFRVLRSGDGVR
ncbi:amino acid ABC transporter substrate-binding protein [Streptomyces spiroverticillatus]|uniref:Amino acid ABC transporter substrate-binding protein n=1 Tax=Streptomyces finlayi TaxID=67296 RepID=A0A918X000_9ACTN|nr:ABC transporter substrate-binding protein [Streptomyces finlayi]GHA16913.1 amino acid ABC transporter substrate-binding protein [Streptomyces spiroverticillatus]GHC99030.1 amino acid ABC transporter substrate-binding protein [Streptomyces finlayi]